MGASLIGHECERHVWLSWRWAIKPSFPGRVLRLFSTGVREESRLIEELRGIGATVWETDPATGAQWRVSAMRGHFGGSLDGVAQGLPEAPKSAAVLEFKTHNHRSFMTLIEQRVQTAKPMHYDQMQVYMGLMELDRAMYMAVDKDTDDLYCEWVYFDKTRFDQLLAKAERLIAATEPPPRINDDPAHYICKMCNFHRVCHGDTAAEANCRTCCHATPADDAAWRCENHGTEISVKEQREGCQAHLMIPALIPYAEPVDGGNDYVIYRHKKSGAYFSNGAGPEPRFASAELHHCPGTLMPEIGELKTHFPGSKVVPAGSGFDDMKDDDLDAVPAKSQTPAERKQRQRINKSLQTLKEFKA